MYTLHDQRLPNTPLFTAERIGNQAVDLELEIDPDDKENPLFTCIDNDRDVIAAITAHQRYAEGPAFKIPTLAVYATTDGNPDFLRKPFYGTNTPLADIVEYVRRQAEPPAED